MDDQPLPDNAMQVFPNPASDHVSIAVDLEAAGPVTVTVADASGKVIISDDYTNIRQQQFDYKLPKLPAGIYLARIASDKGTLTKRFVID